MQSLGLRTSNTIRKLLKVLRRQLFLILLLTLSFLVIASSFAFIGTGVRELLKQNADDARAIGFELITEFGPDYKEQSKEHARMLQQFIDHMEHRHFSSVVRILFPGFSSDERLAPVVEALKTARDEDEARKAIIEAGEKLVEFCGDLDKFSPGRVVWFKSEKLPDPLLNDLNKAFSVSKELVERLGEDPALNNALTLCQANRKTMLLLFLGRSGYHEKENIISFRRYVERSNDYYSNLARNMKDDKAKRSLLQWANSEQYRLYILDAMLDNDMDKARGMMREAIEQAFKEKHGLGSDE